MDCFPY